MHSAMHYEQVDFMNLGSAATSAASYGRRSMSAIIHISLSDRSKQTISTRKSSAQARPKIKINYLSVLKVIYVQYGRIESYSCVLLTLNMHTFGTCIRFKTPSLISRCTASNHCSCCHNGARVEGRKLKTCYWTFRS